MPELSKSSIEKLQQLKYLNCNSLNFLDIDEEELDALQISKVIKNLNFNDLIDDNKSSEIV